MSELERIERRVMELERLTRQLLDGQREIASTLAVILEALQQPTTYPASSGATVVST